VLLHFEAYRPEELMLISHEAGTKDKTTNRKKHKANYKSISVEYENYRSSSYDSTSKPSKEELKRLREGKGSKGRRTSNYVAPSDNPYLVHNMAGTNPPKVHRKTVIFKKDQQTKELKREVEAMT
jgi:hypothetical protein